MGFVFLIIGIVLGFYIAPRLHPTSMGGKLLYCIVYPVLILFGLGLLIALITQDGYVAGSYVVFPFLSVIAGIVTLLLKVKIQKN